jgi:hypothetical protein
MGVLKMKYKDLGETIERGGAAIGYGKILEVYAKYAIMVQEKPGWSVLGDTRYATRFGRYVRRYYNGGEDFDNLEYKVHKMQW